MGEPNWQNRTLFRGDNLKFLRAMNSESVDLIATDPPFNKGRDFHATPDSLAAGARFQDRWSWEKDVHQDWLDQIRDDCPAVWEVIDAANAVYMRPTKKNLSKPRDEVGSDMGAFLCFMAVRLLEMHRVLKPTGSIYLHCDPTASHYLKAIMDAIFGWRQFVNEIVWSYRSGGGSKRHFGKKHDTIFWYSVKHNKHTFNTDEVRIPYDAVIAKKWEHKFNKKGKVSGDVWDISRPANHSNERIGYPTQKPLALYKRILEASSNKGDIVLDPFCGCATTLLAAERLNRQWAGIDIWSKAHEVILERLEQHWLVTLGKTKHSLLDENVHYSTDLPVRTDSGEKAVPFLRVKVRVKEPDGPRWTRAEMYEHLLEQHGPKCQGCNRVFDDPRYLELDHNTPRSDGGLNHVSNRILLCGPCNRLKSNTFTLSGLRRQNQKRGYMK